MAELKTEQPQASESTPAPATGTKVTDLSMVDEKVLQSALDAYARKAQKSREEHLEKQKAEELKKAEQAALIERGQFDTVRKTLEAERDAALQRTQALEAVHALKVAALAAGINDPDDVRLLPETIMASISDDKGAIDHTAVSKAVEALKTSKAYLFRQPEAAPAKFAGSASPGSAVPATASQDLTLDACLRARQQRSAQVRNLRK
jgi:hypothetical protein